jgi:uncharacterized protein YqhQ
MDDFIRSLLVALLLLPMIAGVAYFVDKWTKKYPTLFEDTGFFGFVAFALAMLFATIKVAQFVGTYFAGVAY